MQIGWMLHIERSRLQFWHLLSRLLIVITMLLMRTSPHMQPPSEASMHAFIVPRLLNYIPMLMSIFADWQGIQA